jgi:hypothetical protein
MKTEILCAEHNIAHVVPDDPIADASAALDAAMSAKYETGCDRLIFDKAAFAESFFILSSGLAGEILQKFVNYGLKVAIVGDYSHYTGKPLHDFIRESNRGRDVFFVPNIEDAAKLLAKA